MKPIYKEKEQSLYNETAILKVMGVLFKYPDKEFSLSDLAEKAQVAKANIGKILKRLNAQHFIEIEKLANIWRIKAIRTNQNFIKAKIVNNLSLVYESRLIEFLIKSLKHPKSIILFGSFRKGEDIISSDIDIAVESSEDKTQTVYLSELIPQNEKKELAKIEEFLARRIQMHIFSKKNVNLNVFNNIANGIVLSGFLEVKP
jgi:predicted nucleotidyltransferase